MIGHRIDTPIVRSKWLEGCLPLKHKIFVYSPLRLSSVNVNPETICTQDGALAGDNTVSGYCQVLTVTWKFTHAHTWPDVQSWTSGQRGRVATQNTVAFGNIVSRSRADRQRFVLVSAATCVTDEPSLYWRPLLLLTNRFGVGGHFCCILTTMVKATTFSCTWDRFGIGVYLCCT